MKTISLPEELHKKILELKIQEETKTSAELIEKLYMEYRKKKLQELSDLFRKRMKEKEISFDQLLKKSKEIRKEISDEWFSD